MAGITVRRVHNVLSSVAMCLLLWMALTGACSNWLEIIMPSPVIFICANCQYFGSCRLRHRVALAATSSIIILLFINIQPCAASVHVVNKHVLGYEPSPSIIAFHTGGALSRTFGTWFPLAAGSKSLNHCIMNRNHSTGDHWFVSITGPRADTGRLAVCRADCDGSARARHQVARLALVQPIPAHVAPPARLHRCACVAVNHSSSRTAAMLLAPTLLLTVVTGVVYRAARRLFNASDDNGAMPNNRCMH